MSKVIQDWMANLSWKQQSVMLSALRGPDNFYSPEIKKLNHWVRSILQENADPSHTYMQPEVLPEYKLVAKDLEFVSVHYYSHLMWAFEIIGDYHPDPKTASSAEDYYFEMVRALHLNVESKFQETVRLADKIQHD
jgi:hypothetical protein